MKKRTKWLLLAAAVCAFGGVLIAGCGKTDPMHTHTYGDWETVTAATCSAPGEEMRACAYCDKTETRELPQLEHEWGEWKVTKPANCTENGTKERRCSLCKEKETDTIEPLGHTFEGQWRQTEAPTYAIDGAEENECKTCGNTVTRPIARLGYQKKTEDVWASKSIKILGIGNSLTDDSMQYLHAILHGLGFEDVTLGKAWIGGMSLSGHVENFKINGAKYTWEYYTEEHGQWLTGSRSVSLSYAFDYADWDFVVISTSGWEQGLDTFVTEDLEYAVNAIIERSGDTAVPVWYMPPAYREPGIFQYYTDGQSEHLEKSIAATIEKVVPIKDYMAIIPTMAAMQNFRSKYADRITNRDDTHMSYPIGCTVSGLAWAMTFAPQADLKSFTLSGIDEPVLEDIKTAVKNALEKPFQVTPLPAAEIEGYTTANGRFGEYDGTLYAAAESSLLVKSGEELPAGTVELTVKFGSEKGWTGAVFGLDAHGKSKFWEQGTDYYFAGISETGQAMLVRVNGTSSSVWNVLMTASASAQDGAYKIKAGFKEGHIALWINDTLAINFTDGNALTGTGWGVRAELAGTAISEIKATANDSVELPEGASSYPPIEGWTMRNRFFSEQDGVYTSGGDGALLENNTEWNGGTVTFDFTMKKAGDAAFIFGVSTAGRISYWEEPGVTYYLAMITKTGNFGLAAVNHPNASATWTWLTEPQLAKVVNFSVDTKYTVSVAWNSESGLITMTVGGITVSFTDSDPLAGRKYGLRAASEGSIFENISMTDTLPVEPEEETPVYLLRHGSIQYDPETETVTGTGNQAVFESVEVWEGGTMSFNLKVGSAAYVQVGLIFGITKSPVASGNYFETAGVDYYFAGLTNLGRLALGAVRSGKFTWLTPNGAGKGVTIPNYVNTNTYTIYLKWDREKGEIALSAEGILVTYTDATPLKGTLWGGRGTSDVEWSEFDFGNAEFPDVKPMPIEIHAGDMHYADGVYTATGSTPYWLSTSEWTGGKVSFDLFIDPNSRPDTQAGIIFGVTKTTDAPTDWNTGKGVNYYVVGVSPLKQASIGIYYNGAFNWFNPRVTPSNGGAGTYHYEVNWDRANSKISVKITADGITPIELVAGKDNYASTWHDLDGNGWGGKGTGTSVWKNFQFGEEKTPLPTSNIPEVLPPKFLG